jgi:hypothetical protein
VIAAAAVSGLVVAGGAWWIGSRPATPEILDGWATPNAAGSAIGFASSPAEARQEGYSVSGAYWKGPDNVLHLASDLPTCIGADPAVKTHVQLGVIEFESDMASGTQVVWVKCFG